jgi:hypothetical protein
MSDNPRLSLNQFGQFYSASPARKESIIRNAKTEPEVLIGWYNTVRPLLPGLLIPAMKKRAVDLGRAKLNAMPEASPWQINSKQTSKQVFELVASMDPIEISGFGVSMYGNKNPILSIEGLDISVFPELILRGTYRNQDIVGLVKIYLSSRS